MKRILIIFILLIICLICENINASSSSSSATATATHSSSDSNDIINENIIKPPTNELKYELGTYLCDYSQNMRCHLSLDNLYIINNNEDKDRNFNPKKVGAIYDKGKGVMKPIKAVGNWFKKSFARGFVYECDNKHIKLCYDPVKKHLFSNIAVSNIEWKSQDKLNGVVTIYKHSRYQPFKMECSLDELDELDDLELKGTVELKLPNAFRNDRLDNDKDVAVYDCGEEYKIIVSNKHAYGPAFIKDLKLLHVHNKYVVISGKQFQPTATTKVSNFEKDLAAQLGAECAMKSKFNDEVVRLLKKYQYISDWQRIHDWSEIDKKQLKRLTCKGGGELGELIGKHKNSIEKCGKYKDAQIMMENIRKFWKNLAMKKIGDPLKKAAMKQLTTVGTTLITALGTATGGASHVALGALVVAYEIYSAKKKKAALEKKFTKFMDEAFNMVLIHKSRELRDEFTADCMYIDDKANIDDFVYIKMKKTITKKLNRKALQEPYIIMKGEVSDEEIKNIFKIFDNMDTPKQIVDKLKQEFQKGSTHILTKDVICPNANLYLYQLSKGTKTFCMKFKKSKKRIRAHDSTSLLPKKRRLSAAKPEVEKSRHGSHILV